jgi:pyruvate dehydrogenase E2 component (dihydrolipoamide acetyltransferase)
MAQDITVPDLGDFKDVEVIDVLVKAGDKIDVDTPLITLETEKATMDVPATAAGVVKSVAIKKGDRVSKGSVIAQVEGEAVSGSRLAVGGAQAWACALRFEETKLRIKPFRSRPTSAMSSSVP